MDIPTLPHGLYIQKVGFKPLGVEWPSLYFHPDLKLLLVIYVGDLKMAGPKEHLSKRMEDVAPGTSLGRRDCIGFVSWVSYISKGEAELHDKTKVQTSLMTWKLNLR